MESCEKLLLLYTDKINFSFPVSIISEWSTLSGFLFTLIQVWIQMQKALYTFYTKDFQDTKWLQNVIPG